MSPVAILNQWGIALADVPSPLARLRSSVFLRNVGILSSGTAIGHVFTLAAAPILTRIYQPRDFGALALFTSFFSVMGVAVCLQYEVSIPSGENESEAAYLTFASLLLALPVSALAGCILWALIHFAALGYGELPAYAALLLTLAMGCYGIFSALRYWCLREARFSSVSQAGIVQSAGRALLQAVLGLFGFHGGGLLTGEALGRGLGMSRMFRSAWPVLRRRWAAFHWEDLTQTLWRQRKFPLYSLPSSFLDALCLGLPAPLLIRLYGTSFGGYYSLVWRAISLPTILITAAIADTFHSHLAACVRQTPDRVMSLFRRTTIGLLLLGSIPTAILWFAGEPLFRLVFGEPWAISGTIAAIVAPWYFSELVVNPISRVALVLSGQKTKLISDVLALAGLLAVFAIAQWRGMQPLQTIRLLSLVSTVLRTIYFLLLVRIVSQFKENANLQAQAA